MACRFWAIECFSPLCSQRGLYTGPMLRAKGKDEFKDDHLTMSKALKLALGLALVFGALYLLQMRVTDLPMVKTEKPVSEDALR